MKYINLGEFTEDQKKYIAVYLNVTARNGVYSAVTWDEEFDNCEVDHVSECRAYGAEEIDFPELFGYFTLGKEYTFKSPSQMVYFKCIPCYRNSTIEFGGSFYWVDLSLPPSSASMTWHDLSKWERV